MPKQLKLIHLVTILCLSVFAFSAYSIASQKDGLLKVYFLDVGQGDAIFVEAPNGNQILVDGGPGREVLQELGRVMPFYDKSVDMVVMTHSDADHASGLMEVLERYQVENIVYSNIIRDSVLYNSWQKGVIEEGANLIEPVGGKTIDIGNGVVLTVVFPLESLAGKDMKKVNNDSVVMVLKYRDAEILLAGDIEAKTERKILLSGADIDADVIKVAHHGSKTSTTSEFLSAVSPETAIIEVGAKNRYGHPSPEIISRLEGSGIKYYRTDLNGTIKLVTDGKKIQFLTEN